MPEENKNTTIDSLFDDIMKPENEEATEDNVATPTEAKPVTPPANTEDAKPPNTTAPSENTEGDYIVDFLNSRGVENGMIDFGNGEVKNFNELSPSEKVSVLDQLSEPTGPAFNDDELGVINTLREKEISFDDLVKMEVDTRIEDINADLGVLNRDLEQLSSDDINYVFYRKENPEATKEEIEEKLELAKSMPTFDADTAKKKDFLVTQDKLEKSEVQSKRKVEFDESMESQKHSFVDEILEIDNVGGFLIDEKTQEDLLQELLTVEENGNTKYINEHISNPKKMFKSLFWEKHGESQIANMEKNFASRETEAYNRGYNAANNGEGNQSFTFTDKSKAENREKAAQDNKKEEENQANYDKRNDLFDIPLD